MVPWVLSCSVSASSPSLVHGILDIPVHVEKRWSLLDFFESELIVFSLPVVVIFFFLYLAFESAPSIT